MSDQLRTLAMVAGVGGILYFGRSMRILTQFRHARDIPTCFIRGQVRLRGRLASVQSDGTVRVAHDPLISLPSIPYLSPVQSHPSNITVRLAAVEVGGAGQKWLEETLSNQIVYLRLIQRVQQEDAVDAEMFALQGSGLPHRVIAYSVNRDLVRRGFARLKSSVDSDHVTALKTPAYSRLVNQLMIVETETGRTSRDTFHESIYAWPVQAREVIENTTAFRVGVLLMIFTRQAIHVAIDILTASYKLGRHYYPIIRQSFVRLTVILAQIYSQLRNLYSRMLH